MNLKDKLLSTKFKKTAFDLDGEKLYVRSFSLSERDWWLYECRYIVENPDTSRAEELRAKSLLKCLQDEKGIAVFDSDDLDALKALPCGEVDKYYDEILFLSGLMDKPEKKRASSRRSKRQDGE